MEYQVVEILGIMKYKMSQDEVYILAKGGLGFREGQTAYLEHFESQPECEVEVVETKEGFETFYKVQTKVGKIDVDSYNKRHVVWCPGKKYIVMFKISDDMWTIKGVDLGLKELLIW